MHNVLVYISKKSF